MCGSTVDIQSVAAEIRRGIKKEEEKPQGKNIMACPIPYRAAIITVACPAVDVLKATHQEAERVQCGCRSGVLDGGARCCHLANTTEPSACGGDAALC